MNCLTDYIGLKGCTPGTPESGLYVNSLPGISLASVDAMANSEQATYAQVWDDVQVRAVSRFASLVNAELRKTVRLKSIKNSINLGKKVDLDSTTALTVGQLRGVIIDLALQDEFTASNLQCIFVQEVSIYLLAVPADNFFIRVYEMWHQSGFDDALAYSQEIDVADLAIGWNRIAINTAFNSDKIFVGYEADEINSVQLEMNQFVANQLNGCVGSIYGGCDGANIVGAKVNLTGDPLNIVSTGNNTYGMTAIFSVQCRYDNIVCDNKNIFAGAWWYLLGNEIQIERLHSTRINQWTMDRKEAEELRDWYQVRFEEELTTAITGCDIDLNDACVECNSTIKAIQATP